MRSRIVLTTVGVAMLTLFTFGFIVVWASAVRIVSTQRASARIDADRIAAGVNAKVARGDSLATDQLAGLARSDESVQIVLADGRTITLGTPAGDQRVVAESVIPGPSVVTVRTAGDSFVSAAGRIGAVLAIIGVLVFGLTVIVARRLADSLVDPVRDLALVAARLGAGDPRPARRRYGIGELDAVAEVLDQSAARIGEQIATERQLAADVSHQLRTPLTALSMRLEEVLGTDDPQVARSEAAIALQQVERLSGVVDDLLAYARHTRGTQTEVDVDSVLVQQLEEWRGAYQTAHRQLRIAGEPALVAWVSASALSQVIATLLENSLVHGDGATTVRTRTSGGSVVVEVTDEGPGVRADLVRHIFDRDVSGASRSGLGLSVARALTEVEGGRLELIHARPATFAVFLAVVKTPLVEELVAEEPVPGSSDGTSDGAGGDADQGAGVSGSSASGASSGTRGNTNFR